MAGTAQEQALGLARELEAGKAEDVTVIDVSGLSSWTDFFVIATVRSAAQMQGLQKQVKDYVRANDMQIHVTNRKQPDGDDWCLIDIGPVVVHLMSPEARGFYELEQLWHAGSVLK